jgi:uncharacterized lipoprotein YddW (UPF0748 family)
MKTKPFQVLAFKQVSNGLFKPGILFFLTIIACSTPPTHLKREFRGVWIATVNNIDFPSQKGLSSDRLKAELIYTLDYLQKNNINAVVFQVRGACDAMYKSDLEPWSVALTGKQGKAPEDNFDPLAFLVKECHQRNMELHAWINPFRAVVNLDKDSLASNHLYYQHPEWMLAIKNRIFLNPGIPAVRNHISAVIQDLINRYDIDAIHFDDYFYPAGNEYDDEETYKKYNPQKIAKKKDWRRENVNLLISELSKNIQTINPQVKFGISPSAIWRHYKNDSRGSNTSGTLTSYDDYYADTRLWLEKGWIDYIAPQLYWSIGHSKSDYQTLIKWWSNNTFGKHLYIGQAFFKVKDHLGDKTWKEDEMAQQILANHAYQSIHGFIFFSGKDFLKNQTLLDNQLKNGSLKYPSLLPAMTWKTKNKKSDAPTQGKIVGDKIQRILTWQYPVTTSKLKCFAVYGFEKGQKETLEEPKNLLRLTQSSKLVLEPSMESYEKFAITNINNDNIESTPLWVSNQ